ncbi:MAG: DUF1992 domain-containing protein [Anaerolineae bacterium]|nr:DUF1992 domain-containing protein [Anaerolineae bacterium]
MNFFEMIAEKIIQDAMQSGSFDHLKGKGKPLVLEENPFEPEDWRLTNTVLRANGFLHPWMEERNNIEAEREQIHKRFISSLAIATEDKQRAKATEMFSSEIRQLNRRILDYNLTVPAPAFQRLLLDVAAETKTALQNMEQFLSAKSTEQ